MALKRTAMLSMAAAIAVLPVASMGYSVNIDNGTQYTIGALTGFATSGDDMDGMTVLFEFDDNSSSSLSWADTGPGAGGVSGSAGAASWSLNLSGDTFGANWVLTVNNQVLRRLTLIGSSDYTAFDMTDPSTGTPGSAEGWTFQSAYADPLTVTYKNIIQVGANSAVGDLYERLILDFGGNGFRSSTMDFIADTDNIDKGTFYEPSVPGPAAVLPFGIGLVAAWKRRRNRK